MRVALVHEFLTQRGGAERVLEVFHEIFPEAPVFTLIHDEERTDGKFATWDIRTSFLQRFPKKYYKWTLPLMARAIESFDLSAYDLVLSDSSAFAKGVIIDGSTTHITYCHTPTRYLWESMDEYVQTLSYNSLVKKAAKHYLDFNLKKWDRRAAQRPHHFIANSKTVQQRIKKYYERDSEVIYPPVDLEYFNLGNVDKGDYYLVVSRLEPYKRVDLAIEAFAKLGLPLKIAGDGTLSKNFQFSIFNFRNIELLGRMGDDELKKLYQGAKALVFPAYEDAGMVTLEALASGTPVIGLAAGGTAEFVRDGENGVVFENQTVLDIISAVRRFETMKFDAARLRGSVREFSKDNFKQKILRACESVLT